MEVFGVVVQARIATKEFVELVTVPIVVAEIVAVGIAIVVVVASKKMQLNFGILAPVG